VDHTTIWRWTQAYAPEVQRRLRGQLKPKGCIWHIDETFVKIAGRWMYLFRAVDSSGQTVDFYLSETRDREAAKCFSCGELWPIPIIVLPTCLPETGCGAIQPPFENCRKKAESTAVVGIERAVTRIIASNPITDT
jgi:hypothetical protein